MNTKTTTTEAAKSPMVEPAELALENGLWIGCDSGFGTDRASLTEYIKDRPEGARGCPAQAQHAYTLGAGKLALCGHHSNKHAPLLDARGWRVSVIKGSQFDSKRSSGTL